MNRTLFILLFGVIVATLTITAQTQLGGGAVIEGIVRFKQGPVPGAIVTAVSLGTSKTARVITEVNGQYILKIGDTGTYHLTVDMSGFSAESADVEVMDASKPVQKDFGLSLLTQAQRAGAQQANETRPRPARQAANGGGRGNAPDEAEAETPAEQPDQNPFADLQANPSAALPGMTADAATESVAIAGTTATPQFGGAFDPRQLNLGDIPGNFDQTPGGPGGGGNNAGAAGGGGRGGGANDFAAAFGGAAGGGGGGRGGGGRGGRGGGNFNLGGQRGRNANPININLRYTLSDSNLDAAPYHLAGQTAAAKPQYLRNNFAATVGGPLGVPHLLNSQQNTFNITYTGVRSTNPTDSYSTVPTLAERNGDLSGFLLQGKPVTVYDPLNRLPFANNMIPAERIDSAATGLLSYVPLPNNPTTDGTRNFHYVTSTTSDSDAINFNLQHTFAQPTQQRGQRGGGGGGRGGRGGRGRGGTLSVQFQFQRQNNVQAGAFPSIGGSGLQHAFNTQVSFSKPIGRMQNQMQFRVNRNQNQSTNLYANLTNVAGLLGITGVSQDPADWGLPNLSFVNFTGLNDRTPANTDNWTYRASDNFRLNRRNHNFTFGADLTRAINNVHSTVGNPRGQFIFNGQATGLFDGSGLLAGTGLDFADFLLGLPQQTTLNYGANGHKFLSLQYDGFFLDDWRLRSNLTLNLGVRYEYASPYTEADNHLVNLDVAPGFLAVAPVQAGQLGPYSGSFSRTLVNPDRNNFAPRLGLAWRGPGRFVVRTGYGITYNAAAYSAMANQMVRQPPFAQTAKNCVQYGPLLSGGANTCVQPGAGSALTIEDGFPALSPSVVQNTYGVDKNYRDGYAQQWNFDVQRDLPLNIQMNADYTGTKGTRLDVATAPNRTSLGTARIPNVISYVWDTSQGNSIFHSGVLQVRRRFSRGMQVNGTYTYAKFIDDVSSFIGGSGSGVVQDAFNLRAERGPDNSDQRHNLALTYTYEPPFGQGKPFLHGDNIFSRAIGDWTTQGTISYGSGLPFTPRITNSSCDYSATNATLRPDFLGGQTRLSHPTVTEWFETSLFQAPAGCLGNAGRNIIRGPGTRSVNMTMNKTFRFEKNRALDVQIQASNVLNMVVYAGPNTTVNSNLFGQITTAGAMRRITIQARFRF
ncbi:MAG TPA: TonB-dependent receptor [Terriglobia bacterium]